MTPGTIKTIAFIALLVHGIGHFQGVAAVLGIKINDANPSQSWLLESLGPGVNKTLCLILFFVTAITGILTALSFRGIVIPDAWQGLAIFTAISSTLCLILYPNGFAMFFNKAGAIAVNLFIYYSILLGQHWPGVLFED